MCSHSTGYLGHVPDGGTVFKLQAIKIRKLIKHDKKSYITRKHYNVASDRLKWGYWQGMFSLVKNINALAFRSEVTCPS